MKICARCRKKKSKSEFHFENKSKDGLGSWCKSCSSEKVRESELHRLYNLTIKQYELMLKLQNGKCAICKQPEVKIDRNGNIRRLGVDHCHKTGKIRGLLCFRCNIGLGVFNDNPELLREATKYLEK